MPQLLKSANDNVYWWLSYTDTHHVYDRSTFSEKPLTALLPAAVDFKSMKRTRTGRASPLAEELLCRRGNVSLLTVDWQLECTMARSNHFFFFIHPSVNAVLDMEKYLLSFHQSVSSAVIVQRGCQRVIIKLRQLIAEGYLILLVPNGIIYTFLSVPPKGQLPLPLVFTQISQHGSVCS